MNDVYAPDWYYEPDYEPEYECYKCDEKEKNLSHAADHFEVVLKMLYSNDPLNKEDLEWHLDEVASALNLKLPINNPTVQREQKKPSGLFEFAVDLVRTHAQTL